MKSGFARLLETDMDMKIILLFALTLAICAPAQADWVVVSPATNRLTPNQDAPRGLTTSVNGSGKTPAEAKAQAEERMYRYKNPRIVKIFNYGNAQTGYACTITFLRDSF